MLLLIAKVFSALALYSFGIEPRFVVRNDETGAIPNLPAAWDGKQIAVFADLHVGMWWANLDAARRLVSDVVDVHPAAALIMGDFVYNADSSVDSQMAEVASLLEPLHAAGIPLYAVLGNHDYSLTNEHSDEKDYVADHVRAALERSGVRMLDNTSVALPAPPPLVHATPPPGPAAVSVDSAPVPLYLVGLGERWAKNDHVGEALAQVPAPRIIFMHDPDSYAKIPAGAAPLAIAAHTHAMQCDVPFVSDWLWRHYFSDEGSGLEGWITHYGQPGNHLYVNRGVGFTMIPARLHAAPELTVFTLARAK